MKAAIVFGTRPEIIKVDPVIKELEKKGAETLLIHTGQHNLESLFKDLNIRKPDYVLDLPPTSAGKFRGGLLRGILRAGWWSLVMIKQIRGILKREKPDVLLYQGDTLAIASASIAGRLLLKRPILGHIEAGLRTGDIFNPFPEEISRRIADRVSDLLFVPTDFAAKNLKNKRKILVTGNTVVDAVIQHQELAKKMKLRLPKKYAIVFIHRQENVHSRENLLRLYKLLSGLKEKILFLSHPSLVQKLKDFSLLEKFSNLRNLSMTPFFDYVPFLKVLGGAEYVITDSGGVEEEVCSLKVPCLIWRKKTERPEAISSGAAMLVKDDWRLAEKYIEDIRKKRGFYLKVKNARNPYGDGRSAEKIVRIISDFKTGRTDNKG